MRALYILIIAFSISFSMIGKNLNPEKVDVETYELFSKGDFKGTISMGKEALKQGIDFYFLRYRIGVSYFELKNYEEAIHHLEKAKKVDSNDPVLLEYLYYAYIFTNRNEKAVKLGEIFPDDLKTKVNYRKEPLFKSIAVETGVLRTENYNNFKDTKLLAGNKNLAEGTFYSDVNFVNALLTNQVTPSLKLMNNVSIVTNTSNTKVEYIDSRNVTFNNTTNYFQWNGILALNRNNWNFTIGGGIYSSSYYLSNIAPPPPTNILTTQTMYSNTNQSGSFTISKKMTYIEPSISASYTNMSSTDTFTYEAGITYFPLGNMNFYGNSKYAMVTNSSENNSIIAQLFGFKVTKKLWIELFGAYGNHQNYIAENGVSFYNTPNKINWLGGVNFNLFFNKFDLSIGYGIQERASSYYNEINSNFEYTNYTYNLNLLKTKIVWKF